MKKRIVAEVSKNWPSADKTPLSKMFENMITVNAERGFELESWRFSQVMVGGVTETIIAVFVSR